MRTDLDRLMSHTKIEGDCLIWVGGLDKDGYGITWLAGITRRAHRAFYELVIGEIPEGMGLDHLCRNRACVKPIHLDPVPTRINILRGLGFARINHEKTHCAKGHLLSGVNLHTGKPNKHHPRGQRYCRDCLNKKSKHYRKLNLEKVRKYDREWKQNKRLELVG